MRPTFSFVCFVAALLLGATTLISQPISGGTKSKEPVWKSLFDGKTLTGWKSANFGGEGEVRVEDGALILETGTDMTGATYARDDFPKTNYEVELIAKRVMGNDFFCTTTFPVGKEFCSVVVGGWGGPVVGLSSLDGKDANENATRTLQDFERGVWYKVRIRVTPEHITAWLDDKKVVDQDIRGKKISIRPECDPCKPFGIATWRTVGAIKSVRVRTLDKAP